jgi:hypothetical protein
MGWFTARQFVAGRDDHGTGLIGIAGAYAFQESPGEVGALKHRFTAVPMDPAKGSATGYLAKYISKNIDGEKDDGDSIGLDFASGKNAKASSKRVLSWAATWSIRQFQQVGGPSITVWRELRRLVGNCDQPLLKVSLIEGPRSAADRALWGLFWFLQGGPDVPRKALTLRPMYDTNGKGKYGDPVTRVRGVLGRDDDNDGIEHSQITRTHTWTVQISGKAATEATQLEWSGWLKTRAKHAEFFAAYERIEEEKRDGEAIAPWTRVHNCTSRCPSQESGESLDLHEV